MTPAYAAISPGLCVSTREERALYRAQVLGAVWCPGMPRAAEWPLRLVISEWVGRPSGPVKPVSGGWDMKKVI